MLFKNFFVSEHSEVLLNVKQVSSSGEYPVCFGSLLSADEFCKIQDSLGNRKIHGLLVGYKEITVFLEESREYLEVRK